MPTFSKGTRALALKETLGNCGYCHVDISQGPFELDHVIPRSKKGTGSRKKNLLAVCVKCNRSKGNMSLLGFKKKIGVEEFWFEILKLIKGEVHVLNEEASEKLGVTVYKSIAINPYEV